MAPGEPQFPLSVAMLTGTVLLPANQVEIALKGDGTYARLWDDLRSAVVVPFRPLQLSTLHLAQNRSHVRGIVVDGRIGWTGGFSIDDRWLGDGRANGSCRETNVRVEGPATPGRIRSGVGESDGHAVQWGA